MSNEIEMSLPGMPGLLKVQANPCKQLLTPLFFSHKKKRYLHWKTELVFRAKIQIFLGTVFVMLVMAVPRIHSSRELVPLKKPDPTHLSPAVGPHDPTTHLNPAVDPHDPTHLNPAEDPS